MDTFEVTKEMAIKELEYALEHRNGDIVEIQDKYAEFILVLLLKNEQK